MIYIVDTVALNSKLLVTENVNTKDQTDNILITPYFRTNNCPDNIGLLLH